MIVEGALVQQLTAILAPALPYLMGAATITGQKVVEAIGGEIGKDAWSTTKQLWRKLLPWIDKNPVVAKSLKEVANGDPFAREALPRDLKKLLEDLPIDALDEIRSIVNENISETHITTASNGGLVVGGNFNTGISYQDARQIASDVFRENIIKFRGEAEIVATKRAAHISDQLIFYLYENNPKAIASLADPGMQIDLFEAQKGYARSGDIDLEQMLVGLLAERAAEEQRSSKRIILEQSITVVPKLTNVHLDSLTLVFLLTRVSLRNLGGSHALARHLKMTLEPLIENLSVDLPCYEHLEYANCGSIMRVARWPSIQKIFEIQYPEFFSNKSNDEISERIISLCPPLQILFDGWSTSTISQFSLTTVGMAIAKANFRRRSRIEVQESLPLFNPQVIGKP